MLFFCRNWRITVGVRSPLGCLRGAPCIHGSICYHALSLLKGRGFSGTMIPICALVLLPVMRGIVVNFVQSRYTSCHGHSAAPGIIHHLRSINTPAHHGTAASRGACVQSVGPHTTRSPACGEFPEYPVYRIGHRTFCTCIPSLCHRLSSACYMPGRAAGG